MQKQHDPFDKNDFDTNEQNQQNYNMQDNPQNYGGQVFQDDHKEPTITINAGTSPQPRVTWKNRRAMAWITIISVIIITVYVFLYMPIPKAMILEGYYSGFLTFCGVIVTAYMGFTTLPTISTFMGKRNE